MWRWPIRVKLIVGLSLVIGMMSVLMGGSVYGLHAFYKSYLLLVSQLPELGASTELLKAVMQLDAKSPHYLGASGHAELARRVELARQHLGNYHDALSKNSTRGNRIDDGRDEFGLAFLIDDDLTAILRHLRPDETIEPQFPRTRIYLERHPEMNLAAVGPWNADALIQARLNRLNTSASKLPEALYRDLLAVLLASKSQYLSSRFIVWSGAVAVLGMLIGVARLFRRWVLHPVRLLQRGVRRVAQGQFDYKIVLDTGDEMEALADAFNDMTARLGATYADLERQIQERSRQLVRSERLASVGFLAAGVAHEINNPLAAIAFSSEALENRLERLGRDPAVAAEAKTIQTYLRMIQEEAFRCKGITEKLLDFSRCTEIQRQRTNLAELIQGVVEMIRHMGKYRGKNLVFSPREAVFAHADPQEVKQVVLNLVVNALDSMAPGGTLRIDLKRAEGMAELTFADDGCGMAPDVLENIFEPFFTRRKVGRGTGLGLSITHRIVSQHGGEIHAESPGEGRGATFTVRLPTRHAETAATQTAPSPALTRALTGPATATAAAAL